MRTIGTRDERRRRRDTRRLLDLGFTQADLRGLEVPELRRLAGWVKPSYSLGLLVVGTILGVLVGAAVFLIRWPTPAELPQALAASALGAGLFIVLFGLGAPRAPYWFECVLDRYRSFGDTGASILRWLRPPVTQRLFRKEQCLRLTRRWSHAGTRNGLSLALQERRIVDLLAGELTAPVIEEIHDLIRGSLLDAAYGRIDPNSYETGDHWTSRRTLRLVAEIVAFVALVIPVYAWLNDAVLQLLRGMG